MFWRRHDDDPRNGAPGGPGGPDDARDGGDDVLAQLSAYLDGELTDGEEAAVEALVAGDEAAAELLDDLQLMRTAFGALGEVRAPRSFAIPAEVAAAPRTPVFLFRRVEVFMRASAAAAALFFVVALVSDPSGGTPVANMASEAQTAFEQQGATLESADGAESGAAAMAAPDGDAPSTDDAGAAQSTGEAPGETMGAMGESEGTGGGTSGSTGDAENEAGGAGTGGTPPEDTSTQDGAPAADAMAPSTAPGAETSRAAEELQPMPEGTEFFDGSSQGVGGMVPALGVLAGLLTALSALVTWARRTGDSAT